MSMNFENYAAKGNEMIHKLSIELTVPRDQAARILRAVLHALRERLTLEENFDFLSQLTMIIKGVYIDGYNPGKSFVHSRSLEDFLDDIRSADPNAAGHDLGNDARTKWLVQGVFRILNEYISEGEMKDIVNVLPKKIGTFITETMYDKEFF